MIITAKAIGQRKPLLADWSVPPPEDIGDGEGGGNWTLRDLIERLVRHEIAAFRERQHRRQFLQVLSAAQIAEASARGKVESGGSEVPIQEVDDDAAIAAAVQAFEDGMYLVVIDGVKRGALDERLFLTDASHITFVRLTMLTGG